MMLFALLLSALLIYPLYRGCVSLWRFARMVCAAFD